MARSTGHDADALNERLASLLAAGRTTTEVAAELGISVETVRRRRKRDDVRARILELTRETSASLSDLLVREATASIVVLAELRDLPPAEGTRWVRLQAATTLLNVALRNQPETDPTAALADRLEAIFGAGAWAPPPEPEPELELELEEADACPPADA